MKYKFNLRDFMIGFSFSWILVEVIKRILG
jgi:hypothetical protein